MFSFYAVVFREFFYGTFVAIYFFFSKHPKLGKAVREYRHIFVDVGGRGIDYLGYYEKHYSRTPYETVGYLI
jgi:hypothetical protein